MKSKWLLSRLSAIEPEQGQSAPWKLSSQVSKFSWIRLIWFLLVWFTNLRMNDSSFDHRRNTRVQPIQFILKDLKGSKKVLKDCKILKFGKYWKGWKIVRRSAKDWERKQKIFNDFQGLRRKLTKTDHFIKTGKQKSTAIWQQKASFRRPRLSRVSLKTLQVLSRSILNQGKRGVLCNSTVRKILQSQRFQIDNCPCWQTPLRLGSKALTIIKIAASRSITFRWALQPFWPQMYQTTGTGSMIFFTDTSSANTWLSTSTWFS